MAAWIKVFPDLREKPQTIRMAAILKIDEDAVVGKLIRVWGWADKATADGFVPGVPISWIDAKAGEVGFGAAMEAVGWLQAESEGIRFPDYLEHNGTTAKSRALGALRSLKLRHSSRQQRDERNDNSNGASVSPSYSYSQSESELSSGVRGVGEGEDAERHKLASDLVCEFSAQQKGGRLFDLGRNVEIMYEKLRLGLDPAAFRRALKTERDRTESLKQFLHRQGFEKGLDRERSSDDDRSTTGATSQDAGRPRGPGGQRPGKVRQQTRPGQAPEGGRAENLTL